MAALRNYEAGFTIFEAVVIIFIIAIIGVVGGLTLKHNKSASHSVAASTFSSAEGTDCGPTKLTHFPDDDISFMMPVCWSAGVEATDLIHSSNKYENDLACPASGGLHQKPKHCYSYDAAIYISVKPANGANLQQWASSLENALPRPDPNHYLLTTFAGQPAECVNPADETPEVLKYSTPPNLPKNIPLGVFLNDCEVIWKNKAYSVGNVQLDPEHTDIQQVYSLLESVKFQ